MSILVDTSVWSLAFSRRRPKLHKQINVLQEALQSGQTVYLLGIILQEILQGAKTEEQSQKLSNSLSAFKILPTTASTYLLAANIYRTCRAKGMTTGTIDCLISAAAIENDLPLLTADRDFERIATVSSLRLAK